MPNLTVSSLVDDLMQSTTALEAQESIALSNYNARLSSFGARLQFVDNYGAVGASKYSFLSEVVAEGPFNAVRVWYANPGTSTFDIGAFTVAASPSAGNNGALLTWVNGAFSSPESPTYRPGYEGGTSASVTVPVGTNTNAGANRIMGWACSDWVLVNSVDRTDGGTLPIVQIRSWMTTPNATLISMSTTETSPFNSNTANAGRTIATGVFADTTGVYTTAPTSNAFTASLSNTNWQCPCIVEFRYTSRGISVAAFGDSLTRGLATTNAHGIVPWGLVGCAAVSSQTKPVTFADFGFGSSQVDSTLERAQQMAPFLLPDVFILYPFSTNTGVSDQQLWQGWRRVMATVNQARDLGCSVILVTFMPNALCTDATSDNRRLAANQEMRNYAARTQNVYILDASIITANNAVPQRFLPGYGDADNTHLIQPGHNAVGAGLASILTEIISAKT